MICFRDCLTFNKMVFCLLRLFFESLKEPSKQKTAGIPHIIQPFQVRDNPYKMAALSLHFFTTTHQEISKNVDPFSISKLPLSFMRPIFQQK